MSYTAAHAIAAEGARIGIITCERCGAALVVGGPLDSPLIHDDWHATLLARYREERQR